MSFVSILILYPSPVVELNLMGYADTKQIGSGLRQRIYSRAFIVGSTSSPSDRFVYLVLDTQSGDTAVRYGILEGLKALGGNYSIYSQQNVAVTGTHSHAGPGAWLNYLLPQITSKGFDKQSYQAIVDGAVLSIKRAHESLALGQLSVAETKIADANLNRSPYAYLANPEEERKKYDSDVDKTMTLLRFTRASDNTDIGVLTWFPVHGTSLFQNNTLIAGDNKGVAASLFEKSMPKGFVAGFSQASVGDTTPNVLDAYCEYGEDVGKKCKLEDSTCGNVSQPCHGRGPFWGLNDAGTKSCFEIGRRQFEGAYNLYKSMGSAKAVTGDVVRSLHSFVDFSNHTFTLPNGTAAKTCAAAMGYSFAAGTSDGPGAFDFKQNDSGAPNANPLWSVVSKFITANPDKEQRDCHAPKPILLNVGETHQPYEWSPNIVDIQVFRAGQFFIIVSPGEATTMSGRRWKETVASKVSELSIVPYGQTPLVVLGGPSNSYTHYITTEEEYGVQRYEGASTLYGPHTLNAYIAATVDRLPYLAGTLPTQPLDAGPFPPDNRNRSLSFITGVVMDSPGFYRSFGQVLTDVNEASAHTYKVGETVSAVFVGANPRNDLRQEETYAAVEMKDKETGNWEVVKDDSDWELVFQWTRKSTVLGTSEVRISWELGADAKPGVYRLHYWGDSKPLIGDITPFEGISGEFVVGY